jgi:uncharacterized membrane-anchored protein
MTHRGRALTLLAVQLALVLSIAGNYLYERKTCPRVWMRTAQFDPNLPLRGRYLALQLAVDACSLPRDSSTWQSWNANGMGNWRWKVRPVARDGKLVVELARDRTRPELTQQIFLPKDRPCDRAALQDAAESFSIEAGGRALGGGDGSSGRAASAYSTGDLRCPGLPPAFVALMR